MTAVDIGDLQGALEWVSSDFIGNEAFVCRRTGKVILVSDELGSLDDQDEIPGDLENEDKYVLVPHGRDLDLGRQLALDFARQNLPDQYDDVRDMFRRKGAFGRFKMFLDRSGLLDAWYSFSEERTIKALEQWCETESFVTREQV